MVKIPASIQSPFCPVMIATRKKDGSLVQDDRGEVKEVPRLLDTRTGEFYMDDPAWLVRAKCMAIPLGLTLYTPGRMCWTVSMLIVETSTIARKALSDFARQWQEGQALQTMMRSYLKKIVCDVPSTVAKRVVDFMSHFLFAGMVLVTSAYGVVSPYEGRAWEARVEHEWSGHASFKEDVRFLGLWDANACYLAHCFPPRGNVHDEEKYVVRSW